MNKQTKLYLGLAALGLAGFLFWKSKKTASNATPVKAQEASYPVGLKEGDFLKGTPEDIFVLKAGRKHKVTYEWWVYNVGNDFSKVQAVQDSVLNVIPTGETLTK